jgi:hypothetical protein
MGAVTISRGDALRSDPPGTRAGRAALADTPVVLIHGPHESGKTTRARLVGERRGCRYVSFDEDAVRAAAERDPIGFVANVQRTGGFGRRRTVGWQSPGGRRGVGCLRGHRPIGLSGPASVGDLRVAARVPAAVGVAADAVGLALP